MIFRQGDILQGKNRQKNAARHYIIYMGPRDKSSFIGGMLTSAGHYDNNICLNESHFEHSDTSGVPYKIKYNNSHLVKRRFIKLETWGPFTLVGKLTPKGLRFVKKQTSGFVIVTWEDYLSGL